MILYYRMAAVPLALIASLCSIWLMKTLIETRSDETAFEQPPARMVFVSNDLEDFDNPEPPGANQGGENGEQQEEREPERQQKPPEPEKEPLPPEETAPPQPEEVPPAPPAEKAVPVKPAPPERNPPKREQTKKAGGPAAAQARFSSAPLYRPKPSYPMHARRSQTEGQVTVRYTITRSGAVTDVGVVSASPPGVFESAAMDAVRRWRYQPQPIDRPGMQTRIVFVLSR